MTKFSLSSWLNNLYIATILGDGIDGQGITQGQTGGPGGPLTAALMAGGKRRRARGRGRARRMMIMGGTGMQVPYGNSNPQTLALNAGF